MTEDERLSKIESEKQKALATNDNTYNELINNNQTLLDKQNQYANEYQKSQDAALNNEYNYNVNQINNQKDTANKSYETEANKSKNAYYDVINPYGANAEVQASNGLNGTGYSETSKLRAWNTQQNRTAAAKTALESALTEYNSSIDKAKLTLDENLATNALKKLEMQVEYLNNYYTTDSTLKQTQLSNNQTINSNYASQYQNMLSQINTEKEQQEKIREYNESLALQKQQDAQTQSNWEKEFYASNGSSGGSGGSYSLSDSSSLTNGNDSSLTNKSDYYFSNGYQPRYVNNTKLASSGYKVSDVFGNSAVSSKGTNLGNQQIWKANGKYYVWDGPIKDYVDVTKQVKNSIKKNINYKW